jgi:hypothetical protein
MKQDKDLIGHNQKTFGKSEWKPISEDIKDECVKLIYKLFHGSYRLKSKFEASHGEAYRFGAEHRKPSAFEKKILTGEVNDHLNEISDKTYKAIGNDLEAVKKYLIAKKKIVEVKDE